MRLDKITLRGSLFIALVFGWQDATAASADSPPPLMREFRGAWVATVANINWPSQPDLSVTEQKKELIKLLDSATHLKLNAIILQIRPACDALYKSSIEPWSEYLTGEQGRPPNPYYDPLTFAIAQAHVRGLELHAWFNPFRAHHPSSKSSISQNHVSRRFPRLVKRYGPYLWLDPGESLARDYSANVILDVVRRYDIDGVHLDDYFYPYRLKSGKNEPLDFPDDSSWQRYRASKGTLGRADWRRKNVDDFIRKLYADIKKEKSWVKFGISPFGIWRPGNPPQIQGLDPYEEIFADSRKWIMNGWADYFAPQLYWRIDPPKQSFPALLRWWADQNRSRRHLWPGLSSAKAASTQWPTAEIREQIQLTRNVPGATGHIHFSISSLMNPRSELGTELAISSYAEPALVPSSPWLDNMPPAIPKVYVERFPGAKTFRIHWKNGGSEPVWLWVVQYKIGESGKWTANILPGKEPAQLFDSKKEPRIPSVVFVSAVDRSGNIGHPARATVRSGEEHNR